MKASTRNTYARAWVALALAAALAGCIKIEDKDAPKGGDESSWVDDLNLGSGNLSFDGDAVVLKRAGSKARIAPNGDLTIDGKAVTIDDAQRKDLVAYHGAARQLRTNALATGQAGVKLAKDVVTDVLTGIAKGDTSGIERRAELKAQDVKRAAGRICGDLGAMRAAQDRLAGTLDAFKPFATIDQAALDDCQLETGPDPALATATPDAPAAGAAAAPESPAAAAAPETARPESPAATR
jgi:hypothetical protein